MIRFRSSLDASAAARRKPDPSGTSTAWTDGCGSPHKRRCCLCPAVLSLIHDKGQRDVVRECGVGWGGKRTARSLRPGSCEDDDLLLFFSGCQPPFAISVNLFMVFCLGCDGWARRMTTATAAVTGMLPATFLGGKAVDVVAMHSVVKTGGISSFNEKVLLL